MLLRIEGWDVVKIIPHKFYELILARSGLQILWGRVDMRIVYLDDLVNYPVNLGKIKA